MADIFGTTGADTLAGTNDNDLIVGGNGADLIDGRAGNDTIYGDNAPGITPSERAVAPVSGATQTLLVWQLNQIAVTNAAGNGFPFPNDASGEGNVAGSTFTILSDAVPSGVGITDDEAQFEDGDGNQLLAQGVTLNGVSASAGQRLTPEYSYSVQAADGTVINIYAVELGGNQTVGFLSDRPLEPGQTYTFLQRTSTSPDVPYSSLSDSWIDPSTPAGPGLGDDTLNGGDGNDTLFGGLNDDLLIGGNGDDALTGNEGRDTLQGGVGDDTLDGGDEADSLQGGSGTDLILTGNGSDIAEGNAGDDTLDGGDGADTLFGNEGNDVLDGGVGNDSLIGGEGNDSVLGGDGDDVINTRNNQAIPDEAGLLSDANPNDDRDTVNGGEGHDTILTGDDADLILGEGGNDSINAGVDDDSVFGGLGDDTILGDEGDDLIDGGVGNDLLYGGQDVLTVADLPNDGSDPLPTNNEDTITGGDGDDTIFGFDDNDSLSGDVGDDVLFGGLDNDTLSGGDGADSLSGDEGDDLLSGGADNDTLQGGAGRDRLAGGAGADLMVGGIGADVFTAEGADTIADFDATTGIQGTVGAATDDNDFVDLSAFYNDVTLAAYIAANPLAQFSNPLEWLRADQADGVLQGASGLRVQNAGAAVSGDLLNFENTGVVCFVRGTHILTAEGEKPIEDLMAGDLVRTMDHGYQPIRWIGSSIVEGKGRFAPIVFETGVLGNTRRLSVSPQHRMLLSGWQAELYFDEPEVLVAAKMLINDTTIRAQEQGEVEYFHMLFDTHEIVFAEGAASESFHPFHVGWGALAEAAREEILALFPELESLDFSLYGPSARRSLTSKEARLARDMILGSDMDYAAE